jgi:transcriptional regulator NrdR family protein
MPIACKNCGAKTRTIDSRTRAGPPIYVMRRVVCSVCEARYTTFEFHHLDLLERSTLFKHDFNAEAG